MPRRGRPRQTKLTKSQASQTKSIVKRTINSVIETKQHLHARTTDYAVTNSSPLLVDFLNIPQGIATGSRDGDEIVFKHLKINLDIVGSEDGTLLTGRPQDRMRVMLIKWKEPDFVNSASNTPSANKIFGLGNLPVGSNLFTAMVDHDENGRSFKILYDRKFTLSGQSATHVNSPEHKQTHMTINVPQKKYGNKKVRYNSLNPSDNSHINGLWLFVLTDAPGGMSNSSPTVSYDARLLYQDA